MAPNKCSHSPLNARCRDRRSYWSLSLVWRPTQRTEKRAEERFQAAVTGLGDDEKEGAKIGAAILLRTFLRPGYEQFYIQTFDLAVAHLRLRDPDPDTPLLTAFKQALIVVFKEAFPLARDHPLSRNQEESNPQLLDA